MRAAGFWSSQHPRREIAAVAAVTLAVWGIFYYCIARQIGHHSPGFPYAAYRLASGFTSEDFSGWQAGVRPRDYIVAVNGQPWQEVSIYGRWYAWLKHLPVDDHTQGEQE